MSYLEKIILSSFIFITTISGSAQTKVVHAENAVGTIIGNQTSYIFKRIDAIKNIDKTKAASLKKCLASQLKIFYSDPLFNPPKGFTAKTGFGISKDPFQKNILFPDCSFSFDFYYLEKDVQAGATRVSMDGTSIGIGTNGEDDFFRQVGNFWEDCSKADFPLFFEQPPITDSTQDYIELNFKNYGYPAIAPDKPFRIIKRNNKPLFVPLSRKEFLKFLIAQKNYEIREDEKKIPDLQKDIKESQETIKNPPSYLTKEVIKSLADGVAQIHKSIDQIQKEISNKKEKITEYQSYMNAMSASEASSPARLDEEKIIDGFDKLKKLVPYGRMEGVGLYKINPGYYDRSGGGAQLIFVYYSIPNLSVFEKTEFNYLEKNTMDIFNNLDYHKLKESMK